MRRRTTTITSRTLSANNILRLSIFMTNLILRTESFAFVVVIVVGRVVEEIWLFVTVDAIWVVLELGVVLCELVVDFRVLVVAFLVVRMVVVVFRKLVDPELVFEGKFPDVVLSWVVEASVIREVLLTSVDSCEVAPGLEYVVSSFALAAILSFK